MYRFEFGFTKKGHVKYISHLDLMRLFSRAFRRAEFPLKLTQGFNPHPKFSIVRAIKLGMESEYETANVVLKEAMDEQTFKQNLQQQLPTGIIIKDVKRNLD